MVRDETFSLRGTPGKEANWEESRLASGRKRGREGTLDGARNLVLAQRGRVRKDGRREVGGRDAERGPHPLSKEKGAKKLLSMYQKGVPRKEKRD